MEDLAKKIKPSDDELKRYYEDNKTNFIVNGHQQTFDEAKPMVTQASIKQQAEQRFASDSEKLSNLVYENPTTLESSAKALDLSVQLTPFIEKTGSKEGVTSNKAVLNQTFSEEVYGQGYNSKVINLNDLEQVVVRIAAKKPSVVKPLADVQTNIQQILRKNEVQQQLQVLATGVTNDLLQGKSLNDVAKQYHLQWVSHQTVERNSSLPPTLLAEAFNLKLNKAAKEVALGDDRYAVVVLEKVLPGTTTQITEAEKKSMAQQVAANYGKNAFEIYSQSLMRKATIKNELAP
jgi:peptidyl-prolyl cis-trans isomerase D